MTTVACPVCIGVRDGAVCPHCGTLREPLKLISALAKPVKPTCHLAWPCAEHPR